MFNDLDKNRNGRYQLSNLVIGNSIEVILRLKVPAITSNFCFFRLERSQSATAASPTGDAAVTSGSLCPVRGVSTKSRGTATGGQTDGCPSKEAVRSLDRGDFAAAELCCRLPKSHDRSPCLCGDGNGTECPGKSGCGLSRRGRGRRGSEPPPKVRPGVASFPHDREIFITPDAAGGSLGQFPGTQLLPWPNLYLGSIHRLGVGLL